MRAIMHKCLNNFRKILKMFRRDGRPASKPATKVDVKHAAVVQFDRWADLTVGWNTNGIVPHNIAGVRRHINAVGSGPDTAA